MKKILLLLLTMTLLIGGFKTTSKAYNISDAISITNLTTNSADIDWSAFDYKLRYQEEIEYVTYTLMLGDDVIVENTSQTSAHISNLTGNTMYFVYLYAYYYDGFGELDCWSESDFFTTTEDGLADNVDVVNPDTPTVTPSTPSEPTTPTTPSQPTTEAPSTSMYLSAPSVASVEVVKDTAYVKAKNIDPNATKIEWELYDKKTGKLVQSKISYYDSTTITGISGRKVYYARCRVIGRENFQDVYSEWSSKKYFVTQPKVTTSRKDIKVNSVKIKWKKVTGAKNYTIYAKKSNSKKWVKVKTTSKTSYKLTKVKGKKINLRKSRYDFRVITNAKVNGKSVKSSNKEAYQVYVY